LEVEEKMPTIIRQETNDPLRGRRVMKIQTIKNGENVKYDGRRMA